MKDFVFDKQITTELYRKWFIIGGKKSDSFYDKEQILDLHKAITTQTNDIINFFCSQDLHAFRGYFPILYINGKEFKKINIELLIIGNSIECLNMPGCIIEENTLKDTFNKFVLSVIQCVDIRVKNGIWITNRVFPMITYWNFDAISSQNYIDELIQEGWYKKFECPFHTILINPNSPVTYSIPNNETISGSLRFAFKRYQFLMDGKSFYRMYNESNLD